MALYELDSILLCRGTFRLQLDHLRLEAGRLYTLHGENGSGKSSLLQLLALLLRPQQGTMRFAGQSVSWKAAAVRLMRQQITLLDQNPLLFSGDVEKNLATGLSWRGIHGLQRQQRIEQALEVTGLQGFGRCPVKELSGGQARRAALARALVLQPKLLLLDEPTANLDTGQIAALEQFLISLPDKGLSLVVATHDSQQQTRLGGEAIHLCKGQLTGSGDHLQGSTTADVHQGIND